jgi:hypothetical protein
MTKKPLISRLWLATQSPDLSVEDRIALKQAVWDLKRLKKVLSITPLVGPKVRKRAKTPKSKAKSPFCSVCKRGWPHTKEDWRLHGQRLRQILSRQRLSVYWHRVGYDKLWKASVASRYKRAIERRTAIFREEAPLTFAKMTQKEVEMAINRHRNPKTDGMYGLRDFRLYIRRTYGR